MSILIDKNTKVICHGFTGKNGAFRLQTAQKASKVSWSMRLVAVLLSTQALLAAVSAVCAEPLTDRMVELLDQVCVTPTTPEGMIDAGNNAAAAEGWKLIGATPAPLPFLHNENGAKNSFLSVWELSLTHDSDANLAVSIVRPEQSGLKYSVCMIYPKTGVTSDDMARSMSRQFGPRVTKDVSGKARSDAWHITEEKTRGNCGRRIMLLGTTASTHNPQTLMFIDVAFPEGGDWKAIANEFACR